jgi:hypothetical protein
MSTTPVNTPFAELSITGASNDIESALISDSSNSSGTDEEFLTKTQRVQALLEDIYTNAKPFVVAAADHGFTAEDAGIALAVFGKHTMELLNSRGLVRHLRRILT